MSKDTKVLGVSDERNQDGPDYFGYFRCQVVGLLSQNDDFLPFDSNISKLTGRGFDDVRGDVGTERGLKGLDSPFSNGIGTALSDFKRERLKALLRQGVSVLSAEVDEMLRPVVKTSDLLAQRRNKMRSSKSTGAESEDDAVQARKKLKHTSSSSATKVPQLSTPTDPALSVDPKNAACLRNTETTKGTADPEQSKVNADVKLLLEEDNSELDKIMTKLSDELSARLCHMEQELEELLDGVMSSCRTMTLTEKKQLQKMIKALPPKDLNHIAELVQRNKPTDQRSCDEVFVDLEKENNVTLWRLYYYIEAVEKTKRLCHKV